MFNSELKTNYIDNHALTSHKGTLEKIFNASEVLENTLEKDVYEFNHDEVSKLFTELSPVNDEIAKKYFNALNEYYDWTITQGYTWSNVSPLTGLESKWAVQFVDVKL